MERWCGKVAVVSGVSSGIGWAIAKDLLSAGLVVVGFSRRLHIMEQQRDQLSANERKLFFPYECDISVLSSLKTAFQWIETKFAKVHVLINNAGAVQFTKLLDEGNELELKRVIDVNLMGTVYCTKEAYRLMQIAMNQGDECHIINVNGLLGHRVPAHIPDSGLNLYPVAKHALRATNEVLRRELFKHKLMRLSSISPGLTQTDFHAKSAYAAQIQQMEADQILQAEDVARGVVFILSSPLHVTVAELIMLPTREQY